MVIIVIKKSIGLNKTVLQISNGPYTFCVTHVCMSYSEGLSLIFSWNYKGQF